MQEQQKKKDHWGNFKSFVKRHWVSFTVGAGVGIGGTLLYQSLSEDDEVVTEDDEISIDDPTFTE